MRRPFAHLALAAPAASLLFAFAGTGLAAAAEAPVAQLEAASVEATQLAEAELTQTGPQPCSEHRFAKVFLDHDDDRDYVLAPGGDFEDTIGGGWQFEGGAATAEGGAPFAALGGARALALPAGATATSPPMCVDLNYPTFRFFAQQLERSADRLEVEVVYPGAEKKVGFHRAGQLKAKKVGAWSLTKDLKLSPRNGGKLPGDRLVAFRFKALGDHGTWRVDDLYVDPRYR